MLGHQQSAVSHRVKTKNSYRALYLSDDPNYTKDDALIELVDVSKSLDEEMYYLSQQRSELLEKYAGCPNPPGSYT